MNPSEILKKEDFLPVLRRVVREELQGNRQPSNSNSEEQMGTETVRVKKEPQETMDGELHELRDPRLRKARIRELEKDLVSQDSNVNVANLLEALVVQRSKGKDLQEALDGERCKVKGLKVDLEVKNLKVKKLKEELEVKNSKITELSKEVEVGNLKVKGLSKELVVQNSKVKGLTAALEVVSTTVKELVGTNLTKDSKILGLEEALKTEKSKNGAAMEIEWTKVKVKELEDIATSKDSEVQRLQATLNAKDLELEKMKDQLGLAKRKLETMESQQEEETALLDQIVKKRKSGQNSSVVGIEETSINFLVSPQEAAKNYVEMMSQHDKPIFHHNLESLRDKLATEKILHEKLSAKVITKCEATNNLNEEQKEALKSMLFIIYKNSSARQGLAPGSAVTFPSSLVNDVMNSCRIAILNSTTHIQMIPEVTPLSLGIKLNNGMFHRIIPKGTRIPLKTTVRLWIAQNNIAPVALYQGESEFVAENTWLDEFYLTGNNRRWNADEEEVTIITMEVDFEGCLEVTATSENSGNMKSIKVPAYKWFLVGLSTQAQAADGGGLLWTRRTREPQMEWNRPDGN